MTGRMSLCPRLAGCALLLFAATPALAAASSQAEREATRQLNLQASQAAQVATARVLPQPSDASQPGAPPAAAPSAAVQTAAVTAPDTAPAEPATLSAVSNPPAKIATANVLDASGKTIGAVQKVEVTATGTPTRVTVALVGKQEKVVTLDAATVHYDAARNEITTALSDAQIRAPL